MKEPSLIWQIDSSDPHHQQHGFFSSQCYQPTLLPFKDQENLDSCSRHNSTLDTILLYYITIAVYLFFNERSL